MITRVYPEKGVSIGFTVLTVLLLVLFLPFAALGQAKAKPVESKQEPIKWDDKKIEIILSALEVLKAVGNEGSPEYEKALKDVKIEIYKSFLNGPEGGTMRLLWQVIRLDEIIGTTFMGTDPFMKHLDKLMADRRGMVALGGGAAAMNNYGGMYSYHGNGTIIRNNDIVRGDGFTLVYLYRDKRFLPWRLNYISKYGQTSDIYQYDEKNRCWRLHYNRRVARFQDNGQEHAGYVYNPVYIQGTRTVPVLVKGVLYAVTLDKDAKLTAVERIEVERGKYPEMAGTTTISSFRTGPEIPVPLKAEDKITVFPVLVEGDRVKIKTLLSEAGMPENIAGILCTNILKTGEYITVVGASFFKGTPRDLKKGNYTVCGFNRWNIGGEIAYLAEYKKNKLARVNTGDYAVYDRFGKKTFLMTLRVNDIQRTYVGVYSSSGELQNAALHMEDLVCKMVLDSKNRLNSAALHQLILSQGSRDKKNPVNFSASTHYNATFTRNIESIVELEDGFYLYNLDTKKSQAFTLDGLPVDGLNSWRYQLVVSFPQSYQRRNYQFARYNSQTPERLAVDWPIENEAVVLTTDDQGILHCQVTQSTFFATLIKTWETTYPAAEKK